VRNTCDRRRYGPGRREAVGDNLSSISDTQDRLFPIQIEAMHKYRLYVYDAEDKLIAPAMVISADNDERATEEAKKMRDGARTELRDGDRLVIQFTSEQ